MSRHPPIPPRAGVGRADLLRALALSDRDRLALEDDGADWFGYVRRAEAGPREPVFPESDRVLRDPLAIAPAPPTGHRLPLRMPELPAVVRREPRQPPVPEEIRREPAAPLDSAVTAPPSPQRRVDYEDLIPSARLLPALRRWLGAVRTGPLDLERLSGDLAAGTLPRRLPRRRFQRWHPDLVAVLDFCPRLWPYRWDMHRLAERLLRHCGRSGVSLRIVNHGPYGDWTDWLEEQTAEDPPKPRPWAMPPAGTPVLIVGDLGLLLGAGSGPARQWAGFAERLVRAGLRPLALVPLGAGQLDGILAKLLPILRWSPDARLHPERAHGEGQPMPEGLADLLALAAVLRRVDPPLLRALRRLLPREPLNAGLEGALWCHADVEAGTAAAVRSDCRDAHLQSFRTLQPALHAALARLQRDHHAHLPAALHWEEGLSFGANARPEALADPAVAAWIEAAEAALPRLAASLARSGAGRGGRVWRDVARAIEARADAGMVERYGALLKPLVAERVRFEQDLGWAPAVPDWMDPAELSARLAAGGGEPIEAWLVRDAEKGGIVLQARPPGARQSPMGEPLRVDAGGVRVIYEGGAGRWLAVEQLPVILADLHGSAEFLLATAREAVRVEPVRRPLGAAGWACTGDGISVTSATLAADAVTWTKDSALDTKLDEEAGWIWTAAAKPAWASTSPFDPASLQIGLDAHGVYALLIIGTKNGQATQSFRYTEPGTFHMGSPDEETEGLAQTEDEKAWFEREHPRHAVTLTQGYWLADTPCTQALWQAVMGDNPSRFRSADRPVERVSWDDVQQFLRKLETRLPGIRADLPTEAEWEYACRAGKETALYTGPIEILGACNAPALDPIAWYGGNSGIGFELDNGYDSSSWPDKQYPDSPSGTHPVGRKRPNAWGLYDLLGNVWEWCADPMRTYTAEPVADPVGEPEGDGSPRAVRGGSWFNDAWRVRSAYRGGGGPGGASDDLGFRLCLRSIEPGPVRSGGRSGSMPSPRDEGRAKTPERPQRWYERFIPGRNKRR